LLVVDATQGVQAQTLANVYLAVDNDFMIIPVINKIDLPSASRKSAKKKSKSGSAFRPPIAASSAPKPAGCPMLEKVVELVPPLRAIRTPLSGLDLRFLLRFLSRRRRFDPHQKRLGQSGGRDPFHGANKKYLVTEVGIRTPKEISTKELDCGEVGYLTATIKDIHDVFPGETITLANNPTADPLPGYRKINPMVYCGLYPVDSVDYGDLKDALEKLSLNDASLDLYEPESSQALGFGFRVGFLGLLHMDVVQERLEREYNLNLILTAPSVKYQVDLTNGRALTLDNPSEMPDPSKIKAIEEPS
jgi:GTP-binding protein LepA